MPWPELLALLLIATPMSLIPDPHAGLSARQPAAPALHPGPLRHEMRIGGAVPGAAAVWRMRP